MIQRLLANNRNVIPSATLVASSVQPSPAVFPLTPTRSGRGRVLLTGEYTGHEDATFDIEIVAGAATRTTEPVFTGQGSGRLSEATATGLDAQSITVELKDMGIPTRTATLTAYGITLTARTAGELGNAVRITVDESLLTTSPLSPERRTPVMIQEGQKNLTGPEWDFNAPPLTADGRVPASAPRLRFEGEPQIFRQYKVFADNDWQYRITPKPLRAIPAGRIVSSVSGARIVTVADGIHTAEEYGRVEHTAPAPDTASIITLYDLLEALKGSLILSVTGAVINDTTPDGMGAIDCPVITAAHSRQWEAASNSFGGFYGFTVGSTAPTEKLTIECVANDVLGSEVWSVAGTASGNLPQAVTGIAYSRTPYAFTIPQVFPAQSDNANLTGGIYLDRVAYASRTELEIEPPICIRGGVLGRAATSQTLTLTYTKYRNVEGCQCDTSAISGAVNRVLLGLPDSTEGGAAMLDPLYSARLLEIYEWKNSYIRDNVRYIGSTWTVAGSIVEDNTVVTPYYRQAAKRLVSDGGAYSTVEADAILADIEALLTGYTADLTRTIITNGTGTLFIVGQIRTHDYPPVGTFTLTIPDGSGFIQRTTSTLATAVGWNDDIDTIASVSFSPAGIVEMTYTTTLNNSVGVQGWIFVPLFVITPDDPDYAAIVLGVGDATITRKTGDMVNAPVSLTAATTEVIVSGTLAKTTAVTTAISQVCESLVESDIYEAQVRSDHPAATSINLTTTAASNPVTVEAPAKELAFLSDILALLTASLELSYATPAALIVWDEIKTEIMEDYQRFVARGEQWGTYSQVILERYKAKQNLLYLALGLVPGKTDGSAGVTGGWSRKAQDYWNLEGYAPVYSNEVYHSTKFAADGSAFCTQEFAFAVAVACTQHLKYGDQISVKVDGGAASARTYQLRDKITVPIVAATPLELSGGVTGDDTLTWGVIGSAEGAFADYAVVNDTPGLYNDNGLAFRITSGGIPWALGDAFAFSIEAGQFHWRKDGGTWSSALTMQDTALSDGLGVSFRSGIAPSFPAGDYYPYSAVQPSGPASLTTPAGRSAWTWVGATATLTATFTAQLVSGLGIVAVLPTGGVVTATLTLSGFTVATPTLSTSNAAGIITSIFTAVTADTLTLSITGAPDASLVWVWLGTPLTTAAAPEITLRKMYDLTHGPNRNASALYAGSGVAGSLRWDGFISQSEMTDHLALIDHLKAQGNEPLLLVPHYLHPEESALVTLESDAVELVDEFSFHPDSTSNRSLSLTLPFGPVYL